MDEARAEGERAGEANGLKRGRADGKKEGDAEGYRRGLAEREAQVKAAVQQVEKVMSGLRTEAERLRRGYALASARLATRVAAHIVGLERAHTPELLLAAVDAAAARLPPMAALTLRLHPADAARYAEFVSPTEAAESPALAAKLVSDATLAPGDFIVEGDDGGIDGRVALQLETILALLTEQAERWQPLAEGGDGAGSA
jgi:flagellar biosynthesis/type III secretory pathway protein FliH